MLAHRTMSAAKNRIVYAPGSYTFTVPSGVTQIRVTAVSAGGAGGQGSGSPSFLLGGGGGSGAGIRGTRTVSAGQTLAVVVGSGSTTSDGGNSTVTHNASGDVIQATGGLVGGNTVVGTPGAGGNGGGTSSTGSWSVSSTQIGNGGASGEPASTGEGGSFPAFFNIASPAFAFGANGAAGATRILRSGDGVVIVEWGY